MVKTFLMGVIAVLFVVFMVPMTYTIKSTKTVNDYYSAYNYDDVSNIENNSYQPTFTSTTIDNENNIVKNIVNTIFSIFE